MGKHLVVTTEQQDTALRNLGIPISQVIQPDGVETTVWHITPTFKKLFARIHTIEPDGTTQTMWRYYVVGDHWRDEEPNSLNANGNHE